MSDTEIPVLRGVRVTLRQPPAHELEAMARALAADPSTARWWSDDPATNLRWLTDPDARVLIVDEGNLPAGVIQISEESDPDYRHAGLDIALLAHGQDRSLGPDALRTVARYLFGVERHHRITIDPAVENERAVRAYEKAGFRRVGVMRDYERGCDGTWHDNWLMDMLPEDLEA